MVLGDTLKVMNENELSRCGRSLSLDVSPVESYDAQTRKIVPGRDMVSLTHKLRHVSDISTKDVAAHLNGQSSFISTSTDQEYASQMHNNLVDVPTNYTTVMIRNIPHIYSDEELISLIRESGFKFNFFYCPMDLYSGCNLGYFFVNLLTVQAALEFMARFNGRMIIGGHSRKPLSAFWARIQGYAENLEYCRQTWLSRERNMKSRPRIYDPAGDIALYMYWETHDDLLPFTTLINERKVFVGGLAPKTDAMTIERYLREFGEIEDVSVMTDQLHQVSRGFCFVTFSTVAAARLCVASKDKHCLDGRPLGIRLYSLKDSSRKSRIFE